jgi:hypothetical protein
MAPILRALQTVPSSLGQESTEAKDPQAAVRPNSRLKSPDLSELSLYISTRYVMLLRIAYRVRIGTHSLFQFAEKAYEPRHVFSPDQSGYVLTHIDQGLLYDLLVDIDAILFELNALTDLFKDLLALTHERIGVPLPGKKPGKELKRIIMIGGADTNWFSTLDNHRNFFIHNGSPFIAIDISDEPWDLLIMRKNLKDFSDPTSYLRLSDINQVLDGFESARNVFREHLLALCSRNQSPNKETQGA